MSKPEEGQVDGLGGIGIITDPEPHLLPPNAWTDGMNARFFEGTAQKFLGHGQVYAGNTIAPYFLLQVKKDGQTFWVYPSLSKCHATDGSTHADITRLSGDYSANPIKNWTGGVMGDIPYLNNSFDPPQVWDPISLGQRLVDLPNWPAGTTCEAMSDFKQFLVALNVTKSGTKYPHMVKWSHSSGFNSVPSTWDETDATKDAGEYNLSETGDDVIDGKTLNDAFIIYKAQSSWSMRFVGPPDIFAFKAINKTHGALSRRCIQEFTQKLGDGSEVARHFVFGAQDCYVSNGQTISTILNQKMRRYLYDAIDTDNFEKCFVAVNHAKNEMWACYPTRGATHCDRALVWNWETQAIGVRELPGVTHIAHGTINSNIGDTTWANTATWETATWSWDYKDFNPADYKLLMASPSKSKIYLADATNQADSEPMPFYLERVGLFDSSISRIKRCDAVYPKIKASGPVKIYVGAQMEIDGPVKWQGPKVFDPNIDYKIDCRLSGRLFGFRFESDENITAKISGYKFVFSDAGAR